MTGKTHTIGTRAQVWHGSAKKTSGGLNKDDLMMNHAGRIVSKSKHQSAKKEMRLLKYGYGTQKGKFGFIKVGTRKHRKGSKKMRGGMLSLSPLSLEGHGIDGQKITDYGSNGSIGVQLAAGQAAGKRRFKGGSGMPAFGGFGAADWAGDVAGTQETQNNSSIDVQMAAGMSGGRKQSRRHRRKMRGGFIL